MEDPPAEELGMSAEDLQKITDFPGFCFENIFIELTEKTSPTVDEADLDDADGRLRVDTVFLLLFDVSKKKIAVLLLQKTTGNRYECSGPIEIPQGSSEFVIYSIHGLTKEMGTFYGSICGCSECIVDAMDAQHEPRRIVATAGEGKSTTLQELKFEVSLRKQGGCSRSMDVSLGDWNDSGVDLLSETAEIISEQGRLARKKEEAEADRKAKEPPGDMEIETIASTVISHQFPFVRRQKVDMAITTLRSRIASAPKEGLAFGLHQLGRTLWARYSLSKDIHDLDEAIEAQQEAISLTLDEESSGFLGVLLMNLGLSFQARYESTKDLADIDQSIAAYSVMMRLENSESEGVTAECFLANVYGIRFQRSNDPSDLQAAEELMRKAALSRPSWDKDGRGVLSSLACLLGAKMESGRFPFNSADVDEMIALEKRVLELSTDDDPHLSCAHINLSNSLRTRYERTGRLADIEEAIHLQQAAIRLIPHNAHSEQGGALSHENISLSFLARYSRTGNHHDLEEAIAMKREAIRCTPRDDAHKAKLAERFHNLHVPLVTLFGKTGDPTHLDEAITSCVRSLDLIPESSRYVATIVASLGNLYVDRFHHSNNRSDLDNARACLKRAMQEKSVRWDNPALMTSLAKVFMASFIAEGDIADLHNVLSFYGSAIENTPDDHPMMAPYLTYFSSANFFLFHITRDVGHLDIARSKLRIATGSSAATPTVRLSAAKMWCLLSALDHFPPVDALEAFEAAIALISVVAGLEQTLNKRHEHLKVWSDLTLEGAAKALSVGRVDKAVEWLETGRCVVWSQLNHLRTSVNALRKVDPLLAGRVETVSARLEVASSRVSSEQQWVQADADQRMLLQEEVLSHAKLANEWEEVLHDVRKAPSFEDFLRPPRLHHLLRVLPSEGVVIVINAHSSRCDAMVLIPGYGEPVHIPLPSFSSSQAEKIRDRLRSCIASHNLRMRGDERAIKPMKPHTRPKVMQDILKELWTSVVWPIIDSLQFSKSSDPMPRIWWCGTGPLAFLPLHAAGIYSGPNQTCTADYAISSYTPTVTALIERSTVAGDTLDTHQSLLTVSQPDTPNLPRIPGTTDEVSAIRKCLQSHNVKVSTLDRKEATVESTIRAMSEHSCVHLACHAGQDSRDPLKTCFHLYDGRLELSEIIKTRLQGVDFAFLSACQTSMGDETLSEEAVHLAAGMLAAGYNNVVATMWSIPDRKAPALADAFYRELMALGGDVPGRRGRIDGKRSAAALHNVLQEIHSRFGSVESAGLANTLEDQLLEWVPYVHFGA